MTIIPFNASTVLPMFPDSDPGKLIAAHTLLSNLPAKEWTCHYSRRAFGKDTIYHQWDLGFLPDDIDNCLEYLKQEIFLTIKTDNNV